MEFVRAAFQGGVDHCPSRVSAELRAVVVGLHREFLERIGRRQHDIVSLIDDVADVTIVVNSIQQIVVGHRCLAVGSETAARLHSPRICLHESDSGAELREKCRVAAA